MNTLNTEQKSEPKASFFAQKWNALKLRAIRLVLKYPYAGPVLLIGLTVIGGLSGCKPDVIREPCPPYPQMPVELRSHTSKNIGLVPPSMLPSAKPDSTKP